MGVSLTSNASDAAGSGCPGVHGPSCSYGADVGKWYRTLSRTRPERSIGGNGGGPPRRAAPPASFLEAIHRRKESLPGDTFASAS